MASQAQIAKRLDSRLKKLENLIARFSLEHEKLKNDLKDALNISVKVSSPVASRRGPSGRGVTPKRNAVEFSATARRKKNLTSLASLKREAKSLGIKGSDRMTRQQLNRKLGAAKRNPKKEVSSKNGVSTGFSAGEGIIKQNRKQLIVQAKQLGITGADRMKRADIETAIARENLGVTVRDLRSSVKLPRAGKARIVR